MTSLTSARGYLKKERKEKRKKKKPAYTRQIIKQTIDRTKKECKKSGRRNGGRWKKAGQREKEEGGRTDGFILLGGFSFTSPLQYAIDARFFKLAWGPIIVL